MNTATASRFEQIEIAQLKPSSTNPRKNFDAVKLKELSENIRKHGILQPLIVRVIGDDDYEIVAGERRYRAAKVAGLKTVPCNVLILTDTEALEIQVIENLQRDDLHPLEEAEGYESLMKLEGYGSADEVAAKIGKSRSYVYGRMKLCSLLPPARKAFYEGLLTPSTALLIARIPAELQEQALKDITKPEYGDEPLSYRDAMECIHKKYTLQLSGAPFDTKDESLIPPAGSCAACPKRTGNQKELFQDISRADVCTDPVCFKQKKEASWKRETEKFEAQGCKILPVDREGIFYGKELSAMRYVLLNAKCEADPKKRTYAQLIGDKLKPEDVSIAKDGTGKPRQILTRQTAEKLIVEAGNGFMKKKEPAAGAKQNSETWEERQAREKQNEKIAELVLEALVPDLLKKLIKNKTAEDALKYVLGIEENLYFSAAFYKRHGIQGSEGFHSSCDFPAGQKLIQNAKGKELVAIAYELAIGDPYYSYDNSWNKQFENLCRDFGIEVRRLFKDKAQQLASAPKRGVCAKCGCVEKKACKGGCSWANEEKTLCSACADKPVKKPAGAKG